MNPLSSSKYKLSKTREQSHIKKALNSNSRDITRKILYPHEKFTIHPIQVASLEGLDISLNQSYIKEKCKLCFELKELINKVF